MNLSIFFLIGILVRVNGDALNLWPAPQKVNVTADYFILKPSSFDFIIDNLSLCQKFAKDLVRRYKSIILEERNNALSRPNDNIGSGENYSGVLNNVQLILDGECDENEYPTLESDERYTLIVSENESSIRASSLWGITRGIETFSQLIDQSGDELLVNVTCIEDWPRFPYRGLHLDTARHYIPLRLILLNLDAMSYSKFNVFHWHIVDDQSFPYESVRFPELSEKGAYHPTKIYTQEEVRGVIEYARLRGIRVIAEFDTPGHATSWGKSHPELLTPNCTGLTGVMDPSLETTYDFLEQFFIETAQVFPDTYLHVGGDEVPFGCWKQNENIANFMAANGISTYEELQNYYVERIIKITNNLGLKPIVWEETFVHGAQLPEDTIIQVWKRGGREVLNQVLNANKFAIFSACWYLNLIATGGNWLNYYSCDPLSFINLEKEEYLLGGEACMWAEWVNEYNLISRTWPSASAVAERLWRAPTEPEFLDVATRLQRHTCRMNRRGIGAQPASGPGDCL